MALFVAFLCLIGLAAVHPSHAQNSQQDYLNAHNTARAQVGVANIIWDSTVAGRRLRSELRQFEDRRLQPRAFRRALW